MLPDEVLKSLKEDRAFKVFQAYVVDKIQELNNVLDLEKLNNEQAGETVKVRALAVKLLQEIFTPVINFTEKLDPDAKTIQTKKDKYGL